jgi:hypothetical protein
VPVGPVAGARQNARVLNGRTNWTTDQQQRPFDRPTGGTFERAVWVRQASPSRLGERAVDVGGEQMLQHGGNWEWGCCSSITTGSSGRASGP